MQWIQNMDWNILYWVHDNATCGLLDRIMPWITSLGKMGIVWIAISAAMIISEKYRKQGIVLLAALAVGALAGNLLLKNIAARPRPCWIDTSVHLLVSKPTDFSFPSGHTLSSAIGAAVLMFTDWRMGTAAVVLACLIAFSRLYLFVHFPSDIVGGAVIGAAIGVVVCRAAVRRNETLFRLNSK